MTDNGLRAALREAIEQSKLDGIDWGAAGGTDFLVDRLAHRWPATPSLDDARRVVR